MTSPPSPPNRRRRRIVVAVGAMVVVSIAFWCWASLKRPQTDPRLIGMWTGRFPAIPFYRQTFEFHSDGTGNVYTNDGVAFPMDWWVGDDDLFLRRSRQTVVFRIKQIDQQRIVIRLRDRLADPSPYEDVSLDRVSKVPPPDPPEPL